MRKTALDQTFDHLLRVVEGRASAENAESITTVGIKNGRISREALNRLEELVFVLNQVHVEVVE